MWGGNLAAGNCLLHRVQPLVVPGWYRPPIPNPLPSATARNNVARIDGVCWLQQSSSRRLLLPNVVVASRYREHPRRQQHPATQHVYVHTGMVVSTHMYRTRLRACVPLGDARLLVATRNLRNTPYHRRYNNRYKSRYNSFCNRHYNRHYNGHYNSRYNGHYNSRYNGRLQLIIRSKEQLDNVVHHASLHRVEYLRPKPK